MGIQIKTTITELGAVFPVLENLHKVYYKKTYDSHCRMITNFLLALYRLRGGELDKEEKNWKFRYLDSLYDVESKEYRMTFTLLSDRDRLAQNTTDYSFDGRNYKLGDRMELVQDEAGNWTHRHDT